MIKLMLNAVALVLMSLTLGCLPKQKPRVAQINLEPQSHYKERCQELNSIANYAHVVKEIDRNMEILDAMIDQYIPLVSKGEDITAKAKEIHALLQMLQSLIREDYLNQSYQQVLSWKFEPEIMKEQIRSVVREEFKATSVKIDAIYDWRGPAQHREKEFSSAVVGADLELKWTGVVNILDVCQLQKAFTVLVTVTYSNGRVNKKMKKRLTVDSELFYVSAD